MTLLRSSLRRPDGQISITRPDGPTIERDTFMCGHCQYICVVRVGSGVVRGYCRMCNSPTCGKTRCSQGCTPFEARLEAWEGRRRFHKALGGY